MLQSAVFSLDHSLMKLNSLSLQVLSFVGSYFRDADNKVTEVNQTLNSLI